MTTNSFDHIYGDQVGKARQKMSPGAFEYYAGGAQGSITVSESRSSWSRYRLIPTVPKSRGFTGLAVRFAGHELPTPIFISPMACENLLNPDAEAGMAIAAALVNVGYVLSSRTSQPVSDVAGAYFDSDRIEALRSSLPGWHRVALEQLESEYADPSWTPMFQVYQMRDPSISDALVAEAEENGFSDVFLTVDTPVMGIRLGERRGEFVMGETYPEVVLQKMEGPRTTGPSSSSLFQANNRLEPLEQDPSVGMSAVGRLAGKTSMGIVVKGISRRSDLLVALEQKAVGAVFSAHGGRQLDRMRSTADSLYAEFDSSNNSEVAVDGGISSGTDVAVAMCLGASAVGIGRTAAWAYAAGGQVGLACYLIEVLTELRLTLMLLGVDSPTSLDRSMVCPVGPESKP